MYTRGVALFALLASGCLFDHNDPGKTGIVDNLPSTFLLGDDVSPAHGEDQLHSPYAVGANVLMYISFSGKPDSHWTIESDAPSVLSIDRNEEGTASFNVIARSAGQAELRILDGDRKLKSTRTVRVAEPDALLVEPYGEVFIGERAKPDDHLRVLVGSSASFVLRATANQEILSGAQITSTEANIESGGHSPDLLDLGPRVVGVGSIDISVNDVVKRVTVEGVAADAVARVELHPEGEVGANIGDELHVLGRAYDADDHPIYGVPVKFDVADSANGCGQGCTSSPEIFSYTFDPRHGFDLEGQADDQVDGIEIHGTPGVPLDISDGGCSTAPGAPAGSAGLVLLLATAALLLGRRARLRSRVRSNLTQPC
jgi:hypothetical protein